ncbi:hypothetical protein [Aurantiacibacter gilvus]|uniref:Uncharacterized protein n=1 Tax=Aurantiacibacter gilvus TaxID=3139141 RepID=A0ABU9IFK9_9SPHN
MTGGSASDTFVLALDNGADIILDFDDASDVLDFSAIIEIADLTDLTNNHATEVGSSVVIL